MWLRSQSECAYFVKFFLDLPSPLGLDLLPDKLIGFYGFGQNGPQ